MNALLHCGAPTRQAVPANDLSRARGSSVRCRAAPLRVSQASRSDLPEVADAFVDAFFLDGGSIRLDAGPRRRLVGEAQKDLESRYGGWGRGGSTRALLVSRNAEGDVVGCAGVEPQPFLGSAVLRGAQRLSPPLAARRRPVVSNLAVAASARRRGLAAALMAACEALCEEWGFQECLLLVESTNKRAINLYRKLGYRLLPGGEEDFTTLKVRDGRVEEVEVVNVCMRKSLRPVPLRWADNADPLAAGAAAAVAAGAAAVAVMAPEDAEAALTLAVDAFRAATGG